MDLFEINLSGKKAIEELKKVQEAAGETGNAVGHIGENIKGFD